MLMLHILKLFQFCHQVHMHNLLKCQGLLIVDHQNCIHACKADENMIEDLQ